MSRFEGLPALEGGTIRVSTEAEREEGRGAEVTPLRPAGATPADATLVYAARGGDQGARHQLYLRHAEAILGLATRLLADEVEARDVVQDSFVLAFERLEQLDRPAAFRGWLKAIAVRAVHRRFRRRRWVDLVRLGPAPVEAGLRQMAVEGAPPEVLAELARVDAVLQRLPAEQRIAWTLRHVEGEALNDVAALTGCSLATAKRRIAAAQARVTAYARGEDA